MRRRMNLLFTLRKSCISSPAVGAALFLTPWISLPAVGRTQGQQSSQTQPQSPRQPSNSQSAQQPEAKQKKVWTNDDVVSLRTPADVYLADKEAQAAAAAVVAAKENSGPKVVDGARHGEKLPATAEETRKLIEAKENQISDDQEALDRYTAELPNEPADRRDKMRSEIERITGDLPNARSELKVLQDHLLQLKKTPVIETTAAPLAPPA